MDSLFIIKRYHPQYPVLQFFNSPPESITIIFLTLDLKRIFDDLDAPFFF